jgi:hypothetical protein
MDESQLMSLEGPVIKLGGELMLLITIADECSGLEDSGFSECLKLIIPQSVARILRIEVGDMICLHSMDGRFRLQTVKAQLLH